MAEINNPYMDIRQKLLQEIGVMEPHAKLPSRTELAARYHVNKATVDRVISQLVGEGYLYSRSKSGTYVAGLSERQNKPYRIAGGNHTWALVIPNIMTDAYPGILRGVEDIALQNDTKVIICNTDNQEEKQNVYLDSLIHSDISGIIIVPAIIGKGNVEAYYRVMRAGIPMVFCNRQIYNVQVPCVKPNNFYGSFMATKCLLSSGYRRIAFVSLPLYATSSERYQGYMAALMDSGIEPDPALAAFEKDFHAPETRYEMVRRLMEGDNPPDALCCFNDMIAAEAYKAVNSLGLQVGRDVGIIGYDNTHVCEMLTPQLSSVDIKTYSIGTAAGNMLLAMRAGDMENRRSVQVLNSELCIRGSSSRN